MKVTDFIKGKAIYDNEAQKIFSVDNNGKMQIIADVRGWGAIQNMFMPKGKPFDSEGAEKFQDVVGEWLRDAINEKLERVENV